MGAGSERAVSSREECEHRVPSFSISWWTELSRKLIRYMLFDYYIKTTRHLQARYVGLQSYLM